MTDEEREKLCDKLRYPLKEWSAKKLWEEACLPAADEIERLAKELAQSATEPVGWKLVPIEPTPAMLRRGDQGQSPEYIWEAMMAVAPTPPRPDTSAGLIEAAETELNKIRDCMVEDRGYYDGLIGFAGDIEAVAAMLRARAADRSGK